MASKEILPTRQPLRVAPERPKGSQPLTIVMADPIADAVPDNRARHGGKQCWPKTNRTQGDECPRGDHDSRAWHDQAHHRQRFGCGGKKNHSGHPVGMLTNPAQERMDIDEPCLPNKVAVG